MAKPESLLGRPAKSADKGRSKVYGQGAAADRCDLRASAPKPERRGDATKIPESHDQSEVQGATRRKA